MKETIIELKEGFRDVIATLETIEALGLLAEGEPADELKQRVNHVANILNEIDLTKIPQSSQKSKNDLLPDVINQRELLIAFCNFLFTEMNYTTETDYTAEEQVDVYLESNL